MTPAAERRLRRIARLLLRATLGARLPDLDGTRRVRGLHRPIEIRRDAFGVPSVFAESDHDAFFGLGFCHGQDRAGQLELSVRAVRGTLAAVAGEDGVALDRLSRRIGFKRAAEAQLEVARPEVREQLEAYALGVNAGVRSAPRPAHELALLGCEPTEWDAADGQAVSVFLCFALASNWDVELLRLETWQNDGEAALLAIDAPYRDDMPVSASPMASVGPAAHRLVQDLDALRAVAPLGGASNAWAIAPGRTATGRPILAADPHLPPDVPVHWYLSHLATPSWRVTGASFVGTPGYAFGHNEHCAWAVTAAHADNTDFFVEEIGPDGASVREAGGFVPCEVRTERIEVKGGAPIVEDVLITKRGPVVGPALARSGAALSLAATWLAKRPYTGLYRAHTAQSREELSELFREASCSSVNVVYADRDGHVGWRLAVEVPVRRSGHGTMPRPGWLADSGWEPEPVSFERMPRSDDPPEGFVASANNAPAPAEDGAPFFGIDWLDGYRQGRLIDVLSSRRDWTVEATQRLQKDDLTPVWAEVRERVLAAPATDPDAARALDRLRTWDGRMSASSGAAAIWALASASLMTRMLRAKAPRTAGRALGAGFLQALPHTTMITRRMGHLSKLIREQPPGFFDEGWPAALSRALSDAVRRLDHHAIEAGGDGWGDVRPLRMRHPFGKTFAVLDHALGLGPFSIGGDATTIVQGTVDLVDPLSGPVAVPNLRLVIDVGAWENSRWALLAGQSGNPLSPHHADQRIHWEGRGLPIAWSDAEARRTTVHRLVLTPDA
jgi:penicillin amidase